MTKGDTFRAVPNLRSTSNRTTSCALTLRTNGPAASASAIRRHGSFAPIASGMRAIRGPGLGLEAARVGRHFVPVDDCVDEDSIIAPPGRARQNNPIRGAIKMAYSTESCLKQLG
jgi:hypothetical protein